MSGRAEIETLLARVALRDQAAFAALYDATHAKLFGICLHVLKNRSEAEDALQDVFLRVWHKADRYAVTGHSPMTWLITVARNLSIDRLRARKSATEDIDMVHDLSDGAPGPEAATIARSEAARISTCMASLEEQRAEALRGAYLEGLSYAELAEHHAVPLNTMRTWLRRGLQKLKDCLSR
ncbi:RNA polymerase subunit sigma [Thioclava sp. SK-1]|uniref:sigma-70 family RNA polymerase sigma factor n=1 Tax=Thioclava sp. SK-1 TaxID=1889770 RepID=UPI0008246B85|nr:sigma-70 family RNA polymerase sigma factor [Thioclava sp. SK-1]OCX60980.1 RNA polymerase subunit sigma [Thioclava sp. SK-1]